MKIVLSAESFAVDLAKVIWKVNLNIVIFILLGSIRY